MGKHNLLAYGDSNAQIRQMELFEQIRACRRCAEDFTKTATMHEPRPVVYGEPNAKIIIAGQAPGLRVQESGIPFDDRSGDRLRDWLGVDRDVFYDMSKFAFAPMAFCFPGYDDKGSDLPPSPRCERVWRRQFLDALTGVELTIVIGQYAMAYHLDGKRLSVTERVSRWREYLEDGLLVLPHPSWRNNAFLRKNPWFGEELLPVMKERVQGLVG